MYPDFASGMRRFFAFLIDSTLLFAIYIGVLVYVGTAHLNPSSHIYDYGFFAFWMLYFTGLQSSSGHTIGMRMFGILILDTNGDPISFTRLFFRNLLISVVSFSFEFIPSATALTTIGSQAFEIAFGITVYTIINIIVMVRSDYNQALYDKLSGAYLYKELKW